MGVYTAWSGLSLLLAVCIISSGPTYRVEGTASLSSCDSCGSSGTSPVCTSARVTVLGRCLAACQGLQVQHEGPCQANDPLAQGPLFVPQRARNRQPQQQQQVKARTTGSNAAGVAGGDWGPPKPMLVAPPVYGGAAVRSPAEQQGSPAGGSGAAAASGSAGGGAQGSSGSGADGEGDGPSVSELAQRFSSEGWVYVGSVPTSEAGPQGQPASGFASSMSGVALDPDRLEEEGEEDEEEEDDAGADGPSVATPGDGSGSGSTVVTPRNTGIAGTQATAPPGSEGDAEQQAASPPVAGFTDDGEGYIPGGSGAGAGAGSGSGSSGDSPVRGTRLRRYRRPGGRRGARTPQLLSIRGVRVSAEGGVYLEAKATALELARLPASGSTASEVAELVAEEEEEGEEWQQGGQQGGGADGGLAMHVLEEGAGGSSGGGGSRRRAAEEAGRRQGGRRQGRGGGGGNGGRRARARRGAERGRRALLRRLSRRLLTEDRYEADTGAWPYRVVGQLTYKKGSSTWGCSGTFVTPYDVLTAAHCVFDVASGVSFTGWTFEPGKDADGAPYGSFTHQYVTFYRAEYARVDKDGVNYFDIALIRVRSPSPYYMGIKYSCGQTDYPKAQTCGYPADKTSRYGAMQYCDDCYYTTNGCNPMVQSVNWCYSTAGQSGSPIFDLTDYRVLGVLSGGPRAGSFPYADQLTVWTPIDAAQYATLTRWMWREGTSPNATATAAPVIVSKPASWCSTNGAVRVVGGAADGSSGRAEICRSGMWGTICSAGFDARAATVFCRQLGFSAGQPVHPGYFAPADSFTQIWAADLACNGSESRLDQCLPLRNGVWGTSRSSIKCTRANDMGVMCSRRSSSGAVTATSGGTGSSSWGSSSNSNSNSTKAVASPYGSYPCAEPGDIRLVGSQNNIVTMRSAILATTTPSSNSSSSNSTGSVASPVGGGTVGRTDWNDEDYDYKDYDDEEDGGDGGGDSGGGGGGDSGGDGGGDDTGEGDGGVRYTHRSSGRVEVCMAAGGSGYQWGTVCQDGWDDRDAAVVCNQLGYTYGTAVRGAAGGGSTPPGPQRMRIWLDEVACSGREQRLSMCATGRPLGQSDCSHRADAGVQCWDDEPEEPGVVPLRGAECNEVGGLRLVGGRGDGGTRGRLEVCYQRQWGAVCAKNFGAEDALVACRQLGFKYGRTVGANAVSGQPIWMAEVNCAYVSNPYLEWPVRLTSCPFSGMENAQCGSGSVTGVECSNEPLSNK